MKKIIFELPDNANIFLIGDRHKGSAFSSDSDWEKTVEMIKSPYDGVKSNFAIDHGDVIEGISIDDPRYDPLTHKDSVIKQMEDASKEYSVIADNMIVMLDGNHPCSTRLRKFGEVTRKICDDAGIQFGTWSSHITYVDKKGFEMFRHFATHGRKTITNTNPDPIQRMNGLKNSLRRVLKYKFSDTLLNSRGHTHIPLVAEPLRRDLFLYMDGRTKSKITQGYRTLKDYVNEVYIPNEFRWYASTGSFFKLYGDDGEVSYAEEFDYDPIQIGFCVAKIRDRKLVGVDEVIL